MSQIKSKPSVSIGLPVYNGQEYLRGSIDSLLAQDFQDFELIISDNASTDATAAICREYCASDRRIRYCRNDRKIGASRNFNRVFELARGDLFKWASHDDECHPRLLSRCIETLQSAPPAVVLVYPQSELIDAAGKTIGRFECRLDLREKRPHQRLAHLFKTINLTNPLFGIIKTSFLRRTRLEDWFPASDHVLLAELAMLGEIWEVPEVLFRRRLHDQRFLAGKPSQEAVANWNDPAGRRNRPLLPRWERMIYESLRSVCRSPLCAREKFLCFLAVPFAHYSRHLRNGGGRCKAQLARLVTRGTAFTGPPQ